jgi:hypothetical protein
MAQADWNVLNNTIPQASVERGSTSGIPRPNGGGQFVYGFNSLQSIANGASAQYLNLTDFNPTAKGARIAAAIQRGLGANDTGFSAWVYVCLQSNDTNDVGYMLGLSDASPSRLILRKGVLSSGIPDDTPDPAENGNLLASTNTYARGTWVHVQLTAIVQDNGDVVLTAETNDLDANAVTAPVWTTPGGMEGPQDGVADGPITGFVDDALQVNTGTAPLVSGFMGFGMAVNGAARRSFFDHITAARQT